MKLFQASIVKAKAFTVLALFLSVGCIFYPSVYGLLGSVLMFQIYWTCGLSVGNHRYFGHKCFETTPFWREFMIWAACAALSAHPGISKHVHFEHHKHSDTENDPHRFYKQKGLLTGKPLSVKMSVASKRRLLNDPVEARIYKYFFIWSIGTICFLSMFSIEAVIYLWAIPVTVLQFFRKRVLLDWTHRFGDQPYPTGDESRNSKVLALLFGGEGLHNNHHMFPEKWNYAIAPGEIDPGALFIKWIKK
jgi:fatty-acid desaturase